MSYAYSESKIDLVINKVSRPIYKQLQANGDIEDNQIYIITDPVLDAGNDRIISVADPVDDTDAANKRYVDQQALSVLQEALENGSSVYINGTKSELSIVNLTETQYHSLSEDERSISNMLYVVEYENDNFYGERLTNVGEPSLDSDAATKRYVDTKFSNVRIPTKTSELLNNSGFLTAHQSLSAYYDKTQVNEISANLAGKPTVRISVPETGLETDLSVLNIVKLTKTRYQQLEQTGQILSSNLYVIEVEDNDILFGGNSFTC